MNPHQAVHGGELDRIASELGCEVRELLDFSANLNPLGPPRALVRELARAAADRAALQRYPERDSATLRRVLGASLGISSDCVVVGNGAAALLETAVAALAMRRCVVPVPAFSEDRRALDARGIPAVPLQLDPARGFALDATAVTRALRQSGADAVLLTNPHNPSGACATAAEMRATLEAVRSEGGAAIVDEAFVDYAPEASVTSDAAITPRLVVVRSLTKFYAVPALRVGYAVAEAALAARMRALLPSWPVGTIETRAVAAALGARPYRIRTLRENERERGALAGALQRRGFTTTPSAANFLLVRLRDADPPAGLVATGLARERRVVVRDCSSYDGLAPGRYLRVAVRTATENRRLLAALDARDR